MLCYLRQHTGGLALLVALRYLPVVQAATIGDDHMQPRNSLGTEMKDIGIFLLIVLIVVVIAAFVRVALYLTVQEAAERLRMQGDAKRIHNAIFQASASLFFCFGAILMFKNYFDPQASNVVTWIILVVFITETVVFHHYHYDYHNEVDFGQKLVPLLVGTVLTILLWIVNYASFGTLAFWASVAICPWLSRLGNETHERASREAEEGRASATNRANTSTGGNNTSLTDRRAQSARRLSPAPDDLNSAFAVGSDSGSADSGTAHVSL